MRHRDFLISTTTTLKYKKTLTALGVIAGIVSAATVKAVNITAQLPGAPTTGAVNPGATIVGFYSFALLISGILAFGAIVWGGIKYATAAGNPSGQSEGKSWIMGALLGILLLAGAYFILNIINPSLVNLTMPTLSKLSTSTAPTASSENNSNAPTTPDCKMEGGICEDLNHVIPNASCIKTGFLFTAGCANP